MRRRRIRFWDRNGAVMEVDELGAWRECDSQGDVWGDIGDKRYLAAVGGDGNVSSTSAVFSVPLYPFSMHELPVLSRVLE